MLYDKNVLFKIHASYGYAKIDGHGYGKIQKKILKKILKFIHTDNRARRSRRSM